MIINYDIHATLHLTMYSIISSNIILQMYFLKYTLIAAFKYDTQRKYLLAKSRNY